VLGVGDVAKIEIILLIMLYWTVKTHSVVVVG
jgi:hypothetical protein